MRPLVYPESLHTSDDGERVIEATSYLRMTQIPCSGCGEHFAFTDEELYTKLELRPEEVIDWRHTALWCFRCKTRRAAEAAAARGQIQ